MWTEKGDMNDSECECDVIMWITDIYEYDMIELDRITWLTSELRVEMNDSTLIAYVV